jgi:hypothetical protein
MFFDYNAETKTLCVGNIKSTLATRTLLLGETTKANNENMIGQFGEGYKIAALVLVREGKDMRILNYGNREIWTPKFINSRKYGAQILVFDVENTSIWNKIPDGDLVIEIGGISREEYDEIERNILPLREDTIDDTEVTETEYGRILRSQNERGRIYVKGLYVRTYPAYDFGYDFAPGTLRLDRDRKLVSDFDLQWVSSKIWAVADVDETEIVELIEKGSKDVQYIDTQATSAAKNRFADAAYEKFKSEYGNNAIPVAQFDDIEEKSGQKHVIVSLAYRNLIRSSALYTENEEPEKTPTDKLREWFEETLVPEYKISDAHVKEFNDLLDEI